MNAHIYNGQSNALGVGGYNSEPAYPSASSNNNNQNDGDVVSGGKNDIVNQNDDDIQYLQSKFKIDEQKSSSKVHSEQTP